MPNGVHKKNIDVPIDRVWNFISDIDNWAPLVPGYMNHDLLSDRQSDWTFKGKVKGIEKIISVRIDITEWEEPNRVVFNLIGINEKVEGFGYFTAESLNNMRTQITGYLDITAKGIKAPLYNVALSKVIPRTARQLSEAIAKDLLCRPASTGSK